MSARRRLQQPRRELRAPRSTIWSAAFAITTAPSRIERPECEPPPMGDDVGVARDQAHLREIDAEPLGDELGEARLVALPGG